VRRLDAAFGFGVRRSSPLWLSLLVCFWSAAILAALAFSGEHGEHRDWQCRIWGGGFLLSESARVDRFEVL
jgi:hypothetical protein